MTEKKDTLEALMGEMSGEAQMIARMSLAISRRIQALMTEKGLTQKQFADALGRRPSEISKWLSGEQNFTVNTLIKLSYFFGKPIIQVAE